MSWRDELKSKANAFTAEQEAELERERVERERLERMTPVEREVERQARALRDTQDALIMGKIRRDEGGLCGLPIHPEDTPTEGIELHCLKPFDHDGECEPFPGKTGWDVTHYTSPRPLGDFEIDEIRRRSPSAHFVIQPSGDITDLRIKKPELGVIFPDASDVAKSMIELKADTDKAMTWLGRIKAIFGKKPAEKKEP